MELNSDEISSSRMACAFCRRRKLKCNKELPKCQSCQKFGFDCEYVSPGSQVGSTRAVGETRSSRVRQLESRLGRVEHLLRAKNREQDQTSVAVTANSTGLEEIALDDGTVAELEKLYFDVVQTNIDIIHQRTYAERVSNSGAHPPVFLRHAIWALGAAMSEDHSKYQKKLYNSSRKKLQEAELQDNGIGALNLAYAQSWILISFFEIIHGYFHKAWLSSSRAVRLVQMMKLHRLDTAVKKPLDTNLQVIQVPKDLTEAEERRRIFWAAFLMDRYSCISMGWPMLIDERDIRTFLPASNEAFASSTAEHFMFLSQAQAMPEPRNISTLACQVILASLCGGKINEIQRSEPGVASNSSVCNAWLKPQPQNDLFTTVLCIPQHLTSQPSRLNPTSIFLDIFAASGTISIQRAAQSQVGNDPVYADMLLHSKQRCLDAAFKVFRLMELSCHWDFRAFFLGISFCLYNVVCVFARVWLVDQTDYYETPLRFLLGCMESFRKRTPLTDILIADIEAEFPGILDRLTGGVDRSVQEILDSCNTPQQVPHFRLHTMPNLSAFDVSHGLGSVDDFADSFADMGNFDLQYGIAESWEIDDSILASMGSAPSENWNPSATKQPGK